MNRVAHETPVSKKIVEASPVIRQTLARGNVALLRSLLGPADRGLIRQIAEGSEGTVIPLGHGAHFDRALEVTILLRNRFLAHESYAEFNAHQLRRKAWNDVVLGSELMSFFRTTMFTSIVPNLKRIGMLSERIRPRYEKTGLLQYESGKPATELTATELLEDR